MIFPEKLLVGRWLFSLGLSDQLSVAGTGLNQLQNRLALNQLEMAFHTLDEQLAELSGEPWKLSIRIKKRWKRGTLIQYQEAVNYFRRWS